LKRLAIHPAQYTLVGLALAMFFLLLLSLSEHIGFGLAYVCAAGSCVGLIVYYLSGVMGSARRAASAGLMLGGLFGALYGLLQSEDNSLVLGSVLLFVLLALAMVATRRVDWYRLGQTQAEC
ncbi:partial Inner membrane protein CreD, partial [Methylococcales bacterium]